MRCSHCFYWEDLNAKKLELNLTEIEKISKSLPGLFFLRLTGGEPFLRDDLSEIAGCFYRNSFLRRLGISTNGVLTEQIIRFVEAVDNLSGLNMEIGISIDGVKERHDSIRGCPGAFEKAMYTFEKLSEIKKKTNNLRLGFLMTMTKDNQNELIEVFNYLKGMDPDSVGLNIIRGNPRDSSQLDIDIGKYDKLRSLLNQYNFRSSANKSFIYKMRLIKTVLSQDAIIDIVKNKRSRLTCLAADKIAVLYPDGEVSACELKRYSFGNIREYSYSFRKLWATQKRKSISLGIKKRKCFCTHECFITASFIFSLWNMIKIFILSLIKADK